MIILTGSDMYSKLHLSFRNKFLLGASTAWPMVPTVLKEYFTERKEQGTVISSFSPISSYLHLLLPNGICVLLAM